MRLAIPSVVMRGGSSKAIFLKEQDLLPQGPARDRLILALLGSPDVRQIDGLGGADPLTSKFAIIGPPRAPNTDLTYTFGRVEPDSPNIDYSSVCGNTTSAVGLYAIEEGLATAIDPLTTVRVFSTNLKRIFYVEIPVSGTVARDDGDYAIPGVPGSSAKITVDYSGMAGCAAGALLPTGSPIDVLDVPRVGRVEVTLVDIGNAHVFVRATDVEMSGVESTTEIEKNLALVDCLERIRRSAAERMAITPTHTAPVIAAIAPAASYVAYHGNEKIDGEQIDLISYPQSARKTDYTPYAGTSSMCTGVAARIDGSIVAEVLRSEARSRDEIRVGHPAGVICTEARVDRRGGNLIVTRATLGRTARRIMEGTAFVRVREGTRSAPAAIG